MAVERLAQADQGRRRVAQSSKLLLPGEPWKPVAGRYQDATSPTANAKGEVFFCDAPADKTYKMDRTGTSASSWRTPSMPPAWLAARTDGFMRPPAIKSWPTMPRPRPPWWPRTSAAIALPSLANGNLYVTSRAGRDEGSKLWLITRAGEKRVVDADLKRAARRRVHCRPAVPLRQPTAACTRSTAT